MCVRVYVCVLQRDYNIIVFKVKGFISKHGGGGHEPMSPPPLPYAPESIDTVVGYVCFTFSINNNYNINFYIII